MINAKSDPTLPLFDDRSIEPYGAKLIGNFLFERATSDSGGMNAVTGYVSPGHNSAYHDRATGKQFLIFHTRFPEKGEQHQVRVHQMFLNADGWPVVAPYRYAGETASAGKVTRDEAIGEYTYVNHGKAMSAAINQSQSIRLGKDGTITGAVSGTWRHSGLNQATLIVNGSRYDGVFVRQREPESARSVVTFTVLSKQGVAIWGAGLRP